MAQSTSSTGNQPLIELRHVDKHYGDLHVLNDINLSVDRGEVVVVIGPSGSGKSTMCRTINRLETIDSGEVLIEGEPLPQEGKDLARMRAELGMVFQQFNLFAHMTVLQNVMLGPVDVLGVSKEEARERAMDLLSRVGVAEQADKVPAQRCRGAACSCSRSGRPRQRAESRSCRAGHPNDGRRGSFRSGWRLRRIGGHERRIGRAAQPRIGPGKPRSGERQGRQSHGHGPELG